MGNMIKDSLHLNYECGSESDYLGLFCLYIHLNYCYRLWLVKL